MNKFAFFFPAKIVFAETSVELIPYEGKHPILIGKKDEKDWLARKSKSLQAKMRKRFDNG